MKKIINQLRSYYLLMFSGLLLLTACNKALEEFPPILTPVYPSGNGIAATIAATPNDSLYSKLIIRSGMASILNDSTKTFTMFVTDNSGMRLFVSAASGGAIKPTDPDAIHAGFILNSLPVLAAQQIISYNTVGQKFPSSSIPTTLPNYPLPTQIILDPTQPFVRMPIFPVKGTPYSYVNNLPLTAIDQAASNGIIHHAFTVAVPPSATLKTMIATEPTLSYFRAAVARADSGSTGLSRFDSLLNYGVTNMTVLAPNDAAFQTLIFGLGFSTYLSTRPKPYTLADTLNALATGNAAVAAGPAFLSTVSIALAQGIVAYHLLATTPAPPAPVSYTPNIRVFSVNVPATPTFLKTLVNRIVAVHPGIMAQATFTGPAVSLLKFTGYGTVPSGGQPFTGTAAKAITMDKHAANGVYHIIDAVLLAQ